MSQQNSAEPTHGPDWLLVQNGRLPDWGPPYTETPANPYAPDAPFIAEPWNTVTAAFFIVIAVVWLIRLRGRYREFPFVTCCMPVLLAGGIGGTLFHATRVSPVYFLLDVIPIQLLALAASIFMALRFWGRLWGWMIIFGVAIFYVVINRVFFAMLSVSIQLSVNISYASLAVVVLTPIALVLWYTRFRHGGWVVAGLVSFGIAWTCRLIDLDIGSTLPMGSHWLWHTFGAISTAMLIQYFYKVEEENPNAPTEEPKDPPK